MNTDLRNIIYTCIAMLIFTCGTFGQDEYLQLSNSCKGFQMPFTKVHVIDNRPENQTLGFVQVGVFNKIAPVKFEGNLAEALGDFFKSHDEIGKMEQELCVVLYELYLSENTSAMSETGRLKLSMKLFLKTNQNKYRELFTLDSIYAFNAGDVTKKLLRSVSEHLCEIARNAAEASTKKSANSVLYSFDELKHVDSLEKLQIPMYSAANANAGIFKDYEHFKMNTPDNELIEIDTSNPKNIKVFKLNKEKNKRTRIDCKTVYAVSDGNILLKATSIGFYRLTKVDSDFYYVGQTSFSNANNVELWGSALGLVGSTIASGAQRNTQLYRFKINHIRGNSIPISKAEE